MEDLSSTYGWKISLTIEEDVTQVRTARELGVVVRRTRRRLNMTQAELAERVGVTRQWVASVEGGKANPHLKALLSVGEVLGLELELTTTSSSQVPPPPTGRTPPLSSPPERTTVEDLLDEMAEDARVTSRGGRDADA
ncbi:MAG: helix-turn-helix transcriptional regulator [Actinomycetales bacterium]